MYPINKKINKFTDYNTLSIFKILKTLSIFLSYNIKLSKKFYET